ncbi:hypothetical protein DL769_002339 [Monosporascus sp. CRB-8-3]|nr:hypothetical protein DL769_002339 [Monosporascus sp. CRB-8-3]
MSQAGGILGTAALSMFLAWTASAVSNMTVQPLDHSCASYPNYDESTGQAGPWSAVADSTDTDVDGFGFVPVYASPIGDGARWGFLTIPTTPPAKEVSMRCANGAPQAELDMRSLGMKWLDLVAAGTSNEAAFGFGFPDLPDPNHHLGPYAHVDVHGVRQPGVFLGSENVTTWGFNYQNNKEGEYYFLRLLTPGSENPATGRPLNDGEFTGFIKIRD